MIASAATYYLLLTFAVGGGQLRTAPLTCPDWACVQKVLDYGTARGRDLQRVRVYDAPPAEDMVSQTATPPFADYWMQ